MIEQHGFPECFFTFSIAETKLKWIFTNLKTYYEWDESIFSLRKNKIKGTEDLEIIELAAQ